MEDSRIILLNIVMFTIIGVSLFLSRRRLFLIGASMRAVVRESLATRVISVVGN